MDSTRSNHVYTVQVTILIVHLVHNRGAVCMCRCMYLHDVPRADIVHVLHM